VCRLVCFRDPKLSSDLYEKADEGDDEQAEVVDEAAEGHLSSDADELLVRDPVMLKDTQPADIDSVHHSGTKPRRVVLLLCCI